MGWFRIQSRVPAIAMPPLSEHFANPTWRESVLWGTPLAVCAVRRGLLSMHAASVEIAGQALVLAAPGTFGKTTLAAAFHQAGHRLLSDDMVTYRVLPEPAVFPGPALLRLRPDVNRRLSLQGIGSTQRFGRKAALVIDRRRRGTGDPVTLAGVVLLRRGTGGIVLERAAPAEALRDLFTLSMGAVIDPRGAFEALGALVARVAVWNLERRLDYDELPAVVDTVVRECLR